MDCPPSRSSSRAPKLTALRHLALVLVGAGLVGTGLVGCFESAPPVDLPPDATTTGTSGPLCVPGTTQLCLCVGGGEGVQSCNAEGSGYTECACSGGSGGTSEPGTTGGTSSDPDDTGSNDTTAGPGDTGTSTLPPPMGPPYQPCPTGVPDRCLPDERCLLIKASGHSVCARDGCVDPSTCPPAPPGSTAALACMDPSALGTDQCVLHCLVGTDCPMGMVCTGETEETQLCWWPLPM